MTVFVKASNLSCAFPICELFPEAIARVRSDMTRKRPPSGKTQPRDSRQIVRVECPKCHSPKAVVVGTHYGEMMCFCPACEHVWDCPDALT